jgi:small multidrug resistance family-3 protein
MPSAAAGTILRVAAKSIALFVLAAVCEIGGAYLMWQAIKEARGLLFGLAGAAALVGYGVVAALQPEAHFGRVLAAYGGVFIAGSLLWGIVFDGFRPDRYDLAGAGVALVGVAIIMYSPR